jgi:hypothetical protein
VFLSKRRGKDRFIPVSRKLAKHRIRVFLTDGVMEHHIRETMDVEI